MDKIIEVKNLSFSYDGNQALSDISFSISKGDYVAIAGPNGAGKTTLVKVILGLEKDFTGTIRLLGNDYENFDSWSKIGYLPQKINNFNPLFPATVEEVVSLGLLADKKFPKRHTKQDKQKIERVLELLAIKNLEYKMITQLSGGQQQRVFLARALVSDPQIIILDEPSTALDPQTREVFYDLVQKLNKEHSVTIIIITHDTTQIDQYANRLLYLDRKMIFFGEFKDFYKDESFFKYQSNFSHEHRCSNCNN